MPSSTAWNSRYCDVEGEFLPGSQLKSRTARPCEAGLGLKTAMGGHPVDYLPKISPNAVRQRAFSTGVPTEMRNHSGRS